MPRLHPDLDFLARFLTLPISEGIACADGRFHAALAGTDTLIVDIARRSYHRVPDMRPRRFEDAAQDGIAQTSLHLESIAIEPPDIPRGSSTLVVTSRDETFWTPLPDPRAEGMPRIAQRQPTSWTFQAPPASESYRPRNNTVVEWLGTVVALAVLLLLCAMGLQALVWSMAGGWNLLWLLAGLPMFLFFGALTLFVPYRLIRPAVPPRLALDAIDVDRDERFRIGEPLSFRLDATVPTSGGSKRTQAPAGITARLVVRTVRDAQDGSWSLVDQICCLARAGCIPSAANGIATGRVHYAASLTAPRTTPRHAQESWYLALYDSEQEDAEPFHVSGLATPPPDTPYGLAWHPDRHAQLEALLHDKGLELVLKAYNGEDASWGLARQGAAVYRDDFTPAEREAVFTVDFEDLVDHAMTTRWYETEIQNERIGGDGSTYLLKEDGTYKLMFTERGWTESLYATPDLRSAVAHYLAAERSFVAELAGAQAVRVRSPYRC